MSEWGCERVLMWERVLGYPKGLRSVRYCVGGCARPYETLCERGVRGCEHHLPKVLLLAAFLLSPSLLAFCVLQDIL